MTRKDYELIAAAIMRAYKAHAPESGAASITHDAGVETAARELADSLAADNARFNRSRFLKACGVQS